MVMHISGEHAAVDGSARNTKHAAATTGSDSLSAIPEIQKACVQCGATTTPLWRNGPTGPKTLCNACGVKLQRHYNRERALRAIESDAREHALSAPDTPPHSGDATCQSGGSLSGGSEAPELINFQRINMQHSRSNSLDAQDSSTSSRGRPLRNIAARLRLTRTRVPTNSTVPSSDDDISNRSGSRSRSRHDASSLSRATPVPPSSAPQAMYSMAAPNPRSGAAGDMHPASQPTQVAAMGARTAEAPLRQMKSDNGMFAPTASPDSSCGSGRVQVDGLQLVLPSTTGARMCLNNVSAVLQQQQESQHPNGGLSQQCDGSSGGPVLYLYGADGACLAFAAAPPPGGPNSVAAWRSASPQSVAWNSGYGWSLLFLRHVDYLAFKEMLLTWHAERTVTAVMPGGSAQMTIPVKRERSPPSSHTWSQPIKERSGAVPLTAMQQELAQHCSLNSTKRARSAGVPIPCSRPADAHPAVDVPKRSRSAVRSQATRIPSADGGRSFVRCGSLASGGMGPENGSLSFNSLNLARNSAPAGSGMFRELNGVQFPGEYERMESTVGSARGSSGAHGDCLAATYNESEKSPQVSGESAVHGGSAAGSLLEGSLLEGSGHGSLPRQASFVEEAEKCILLHRGSGTGNGHQSSAVAYMRSGDDKAPDSFPQGKEFAQETSHKMQAHSLDSSRMLGSFGNLDGFCSPLGEFSNGSTGTAFSGLSARFGSLHVASSPGTSEGFTHQQSIMSLTNSLSDTNAGASMRHERPHLPSTPSFGSMPMLASSEHSYFPGTLAYNISPFANGGPMHSSLEVAEQLGQQQRAGTSESALFDLDEHFSSPDSSFALSVLDELDAADMDPLDPMFLDQLRDPCPGTSEAVVRGGSAAWDALGSEIMDIVRKGGSQKWSGEGAEAARKLEVESGVPMVRRHTLPAACGMQEQQFSFVAAHNMGQGSSGKPLFLQSSKPPLPPQSPSGRSGSAYGCRSPQHALRRSSSERGAFFSEHSHSGFEGGGLVHSCSGHLPLSRRRSVSTIECTSNVPFTMGIPEHGVPEAATSHLADFFSSDGYCNNDVDTPSPLYELLMDQDLALIPEILSAEDRDISFDLMKL